MILRFLGGNIMSDFFVSNFSEQICMLAIGLIVTQLYFVQKGMSRIFGQINDQKKIILDAKFFNGFHLEKTEKLEKQLDILEREMTHLREGPLNFRAHKRILN
jgi:hypothetical protein